MPSVTKKLELGLRYRIEARAQKRQPEFSRAPALGHPLTKHLIHARLPACACAFEIRHHFGVIAHNVITTANYNFGFVAARAPATAALPRQVSRCARRGSGRPD